MTMFGTCAVCCCKEEFAAGYGHLRKVVPTTFAGQSNRRLWEAAHAGDITALNTLLWSGVDANAVDPESSPRSRNATALIKAARAGHEQVVQVFAQDPSIDVNAVTSDEITPARNNQTALHWAAREGHAEVTKLLLRSPIIEPNLKTQLGFTAAMIAAQNGYVDVVEALSQDSHVDLRYAWETPENMELSALSVAIVEGHAGVVKVLASMSSRHRPDINALFQGLTGRCTPLLFACQRKVPSVVEALLDAKADPDILGDDNMSPLEVAVEDNSSEIIMILMAAAANSDRVFSTLRRAQISGNAKQLRQVYMADMVSGRRDTKLQALHRCVLENNQDQLVHEVKVAEQEVMSIVDGGNLPAVYLAVELGLWHMVRTLMEKHGMLLEFVDKLLAGEYGKITRVASSLPGERMFDLCKALLADNSPVLRNASLAVGAFSILKPFLGSVVALSYMKRNVADFDLLRKMSSEHIHAIYDRVDGEVTMSTLKRLGLVGEKENREHRRQNDPGCMPELKYFLDEEHNIRMGGNHEFAVAHSLALAAFGANALFEEDMQKLLKPYPVELGNTPPKGFTRMFNKLMNPAEHGDPRIPKPRPMRNLDIIRAMVTVKEPQDVQRVYMAIKSRYNVVRVKNNYDPATGEGFGGYRNLLVNFAFNTGVSLSDMFGHGSYTYDAKDGERKHKAADSTAEVWLNYCKALRPVSDWCFAMQALWRAARLEPDRKLVIVAEVQIILKPYMRGRELSHMLYKISRCGTGRAGLAEMSRDFAVSFRETTPELAKAQAAVEAIPHRHRSVSL